MVLQIICNSIMFLAYAVNIGYFVYKFVDIVRGLKTLWEETAIMVTEEHIENMAKTKIAVNRQVFDLHYSKYGKKMLKILLVCFIVMIIIIVTCLFDGLSFTEDPIITICFIVGVGATGFFFLLIYVGSCILEYKFKLISYYREMHEYKIGKHSFKVKRSTMLNYVPIVGFISMIFALNTALVVYTIMLLCM